MDPADLQDLRLAQDLQDMRLRKKKRQTVRPLPGSLYLAKTSGVARIPLRAAVCGLPPGRHSPQQVPLLPYWDQGSSWFNDWLKGNSGFHPLNNYE